MRVGVIFAHMGRGGDSQADWYRLARPLAERGYLVLTYNRRGVCSAPRNECSAGASDYASRWKDVVAAAEAIRSRGATTLVWIGASIGAMASLHASLSQRIEPPALIEIGGVNHASGYDFSREQLRRLEILPSAQHGTDMLRKGEPTARPLVQLVLKFLMQTVPPRGEAPR